MAAPGPLAAPPERAPADGSPAGEAPRYLELLKAALAGRLEAGAWELQPGVLDGRDPHRRLNRALSALVAWAGRRSGQKLALVRRHDPARPPGRGR